MTESQWTDWHSKLHGTLRRTSLLPQGSAIAIACSGGKDSLLLAQLLRDLQPKWRWELHLIHCDHQWRDDSQANATFVLEWADSRQLPATLCTPASNETSLPRTEAAARRWRYEQLQTIAQRHRCTHVVTGHTASDRAETLLFNLVRGSGSRGLGALVSRRSLTPTLTLVRPLLDWTRQETTQGCQDLQLTPWEDSTNADLRYRRNRMRHDVLPLLTQHFNPKAERTLAHAADRLHAESEYLDQCATQALSTAAADDQSPPLRLTRKTLAALPLALQRRSLYLWLNRHCPKTITFVAIESVIPLLSAPNRTQTPPFPGGGYLQVQRDHLVWIPPSP